MNTLTLGMKEAKQIRSSLALTIGTKWNVLQRQAEKDGTAFDMDEFIKTLNDVCPIYSDVKRVIDDKDITNIPF